MRILLVEDDKDEVLARLIERFDPLNRMINDLMLLSKFDTSQVDLNRVPLRLDLLIKDLYDLFQVLAEEKGICSEMSTVLRRSWLETSGVFNSSSAT
jgi:signal transduction histidine kinase